MIGKLARRVGTGGDEGATLVLALLFVAVVALVGGALIGLAGSSLKQTTSLTADRSKSYAAESAVQVAIQQVRSLQTLNTAPGYGTNSINPCPTTSVSIAGDGVNGAPKSEAFDVMCGVGQAPLPFQRTITFAACLSGTAAANCMVDPSSGNGAFVPKPQYPGAIVIATTTFNDLASGCHVTNFNDNCFAPGTSVTVSNWNIAQSDS